MVRRVVVAVVLMVAATAASGQTLELTSPLGRKLYAMADDAAETAAKAKVAASPKDVGLLLALSKAQAARRQYKEAVATDTVALAMEPANAHLLLERGHRELGLRMFQAAELDLVAALKANPKMADAWYHLGLAHFFLGEFDGAAVAFARARRFRVPTDMDNVVDDTAWLYASLRMAGQESEAAEALTQVPAEYTVTGHPAIYLQVVRFYQGKLTPAQAQAAKPKGPEDNEGELSYNTTSFAVGNWFLYEKKDRARAVGIYKGVVEGEAWNSWGFIGSEVELGRK